MSPELKEVSEFYTNRINSKVREIKRLRAYIEQLESAEKNISSEYAVQIKTKNGEIEKLRLLLAEQEGIAKKLKSRASAGWIAIQKSEKIGKTDELNKLRSYILEIENSEKRLSAEYAEQIAEKDKQINKLVNMLRLREDSNRMLSEKLDGKIIAERSYVNRIKNAIARKESFNRDIIGRLTGELAQKNEEVERLREDSERQEKLLRRFESEVSEYKRRQDSLEAFLYEKDSMKHKLEKNFSQKLKSKDYEIESLGKELRKRFDSKPAAKSYEEIAELKVKLAAKDEESTELAQRFADIKEQNRIMMKRLEERQKLFVESENTYNRLVRSMQLQHENRVKELMHTNSQREVELKTEIESLRAGQREKETLLAEKESRIDETLLQFSETSKRLLELKGAEGTADETTITELKEKEAEINKLLQEADERIKAAIIKEHEVARREELLIKEQEAINTELSILKNAGVEVQRDKEYLKEKIRQYGTPSGAALERPVEVIAQKITQEIEEMPPLQAEEVSMAPESVDDLPEVELPVELKGKGASLSEKAVKKEEVLEILRRAKKSVPVTKAILKTPVKAVNGKKVGQSVFKQAKSRVKQLPRPPLSSIRAKVDRPKIREALIKEAAKREAFPEIGGYGEMEEIKSIISIGLQHGDSIEQIRSSLEASGYSNKTIDKAFQLVKKS